tara:strand:- start:5994 stop:7463 length:1470 start_codon:yes stop_codon:yes gene_type:complete
MSDSRKRAILAQGKENRLDSALNALTMSAVGYFKSQDDKIEEERLAEEYEKKQNVQFRKSQVNQLTSKMPSIDPNKYGDVLFDNTAFVEYSEDVRKAIKATEVGKNYTPRGSVLSDIANETLFEYGGRAIDYSPGISIDEIDNYEAYLFGKNAVGTPLEIANRNNWGGALEIEENTDSAYFGKAVIDSEQYADLIDKGLIDYMPSDVSGFYLLEKNDVDQIQQNWEYWKSGFYSSGELQTPDSVTRLIQENNQEIREKESELLKNENYKSMSDSIYEWNKIVRTPFADGDQMGGILEHSDKLTDFKFKYQETPESLQEIESMSLKDFQENFPGVYQLYHSHISMADAASFYYSNKNMIDAELIKMPDVNLNWQKHLQAYSDVNNIRMQEGMLMDMQESEYMKMNLMNFEGKSSVVNELSLLDQNIFNPVYLESLPVNQLDAILNKLINIENSFKENDDIGAMLFLERYGFGSVPPGQALARFIEERSQR